MDLRVRGIWEVPHQPEHHCCYDSDQEDTREAHVDEDFQRRGVALVQGGDGVIGGVTAETSSTNLRNAFPLVDIAVHVRISDGDGAASIRRDEGLPRLAFTLPDDLHEGWVVDLAPLLNLTKGCFRTRT